MILDFDSLRSLNRRGGLAALAAELALVAHRAVCLTHLTTLAALAGASGLGVLLFLAFERLTKLSFGLFCGLTLYIFFRSHHGPLFIVSSVHHCCNDMRHPQPSDGSDLCVSPSAPFQDLD